MDTYAQFNTNKGAFRLDVYESTPGWWRWSLTLVGRPFDRVVYRSKRMDYDTAFDAGLRKLAEIYCKVEGRDGWEIEGDINVCASKNALGY